MRALQRLTALFASALAAAGGGACGPAGRPVNHVDRTGLNVDTCGGQTDFDLLDGLTSGPGKVADYVEFRMVDPWIDAGPNGYSTQLQGKPCAGATNLAACQQALGTATTSTGFDFLASVGQGASYDYFVTTRGDAVGVVDSFDKLVALVAPVMTVHNAALLATKDPDTQSPSSLPIECGAATGASVPGGFQIVTGGGCWGESRLFVSTDGKDIHVVASVPSTCTGGRRPEGMRAEALQGERTLGSFFAGVAQLEAASVFSFDRLARELGAHGAPAPLRAAAERSKLDEVRHAFATMHLARRFRASATAIVVGPLHVRPLFEVALENAVEGCVHETFGALVAAYQAQHAENRQVARTMSVIASDEARHAALAWEVAAWAEPHLTEAERAMIAEARRVAAEELRASLALEPAPDLARDAGIPGADQAVAMFDRLAPDLWA